MILVCTPDDLFVSSANKDLNDIGISDFSCGYRPFQQADLVVFMANSVNFKILKCRYALDDERAREQLRFIGL